MIWLALLWPYLTLVAVLLAVPVFLLVRAEVRRARVARRYARREGLVDLTGVRRG